MEWERDEENEPVHAWSRYAVSTRWTPRSASHILMHNGVHMGVVWILNVCSIQVSRWCKIELHEGRLVSISHVQRCFLTRPSRQNVDSHSRFPENGTRDEAKGRCGNKCWNLDTVQEVARNECLAGFHQPQDRCFQGVRWWLQHPEDPLDVSLCRTDSSIQSLGIVFCRETRTSKWNEPQGRLEHLQSQSQLPVTGDHFSASHSLLQNGRAQSPSPRSESGEQRCRLQSPPFRCWSGSPTGFPVRCEARIHGTPKPAWWKASWRFNQCLQIITRQYATRNAPRGDVQWHAGVYEA